MNHRKNIFLYLIGNNSSIFGDVLLTTGLALHIMSITNSPKAFGSILALTYLPRFLFCFFSGAIVDRLDKKKLMISLDLLRAFILLCLYFINVFSLKVITPLIICFALVDSFYLPAGVSIVPAMFKKNMVSKVNSMDQSIRSSLNVLSPMVASILFTILGLRLIILNFIMVFCRVLYLQVLS